MIRLFKRIVILVSLSIFSITYCYANDTEIEVPIGGLRFIKNNSVSIESEDLFVSENLIRVKYRYFNSTNSPVTATIAFPLPDIPPYSPDIPSQMPGDEEYPDFLYHPEQFKFSTRVDGTPVTFERVDQAIFNGHDIGKRLSQLGVPLNRFSEHFSGAIENLLVADKKKLKDDGILDGNGRQDAKWTLRTMMVRTQKFPPHAYVDVVHEYQPRGGGTVTERLLAKHRNSIPSKDLADWRKRHCIDDDFFSTLDRDAKKYFHSEAWISYVLTTGANWKGPIKDFRLVIDKGSPEALLSFCGHGVKKISPTQFEVRYKNFEPKEDLNVLILTRNPKPEKSEENESRPQQSNETFPPGPKQDSGKFYPPQKYNLQ